MYKRNIIIIFILLIVIIISLFFVLKRDEIFNIKSKDNKNEINEISNDNNSKEVYDEGDINLKINVIIGDKTFTATLDDNETSKKFINMLPLEINMNDLHSNEKYYYLDEELPTNSYNPKKINKGDVMLFGSNCLVLFYKSFDTFYSYTKLGKIDNPSELDKALGSGNVVVRIESR